MPTALTDSEMTAVMSAAQPLTPKDRGASLRDVAAELSKHPELGAGLVHPLVREVQRRHFHPPSLNSNAGVPRAGRVGRPSVPFQTMG